jgi:hypothetical protein
MAQQYPLPPTYQTSDPASLAYDSARRRWPVILTGAIDDMYRSVSQCEEDDKRNEGKRITEDLARLKYEVQHGRIMTYVGGRSSLWMTRRPGMVHLGG